MTKIKIELNDYRIDSAKLELIKRAVKDFPNDTIRELSVRLGMSERTIYRFKNKHAMIIGKDCHEKSEDFMVKRLKNLGYAVVKLQK